MIQVHIRKIHVLVCGVLLLTATAFAQSGIVQHERVRIGSTFADPGANNLNVEGRITVQDRELALRGNGTRGFLSIYQAANDFAVQFTGPSTGLTAHRALEFLIGDVGRTVTITGNPTLHDNMTWSGQVVMSTVACPTGWTRLAAADNRVVRLAAAAGSTGGADTHDHPLPDTGPPSAGSSEVDFNDDGTTITVAQNNHTHAFGGNSGSASTLPAYYTFIACRKD